MEILDSANIMNDGPRVYEFASKGQRLANYFIDFVASTILSMVFMFAYALVFHSSDIELFFEESNTIAEKIMDYLFGAIATLTYYICTESLLKGKSVGKYVTKTRAVAEDNRVMDFPTIVKRSLCRLIPFEAFSFLGELGHGWHDTLSQTKVIQDTEWFDPDVY